MSNNFKPFMPHSLLSRNLVSGLLFVCLGMLGCGGPSDKAAVTGTVAWNGQPVQQGFVTFQPLDTRYPPESGPIRDGQFSFYAWPGKNRVRFQATKELGYNQSMRQPNLVQFIPPQYDQKSTLEKEVSATGVNAFDFNLTGQEP